MSRSERKRERAKQSAAILFNENSELLPVTRQKLVKLRETLKQEELTPWFWFNSRGVKVTGFYETDICLSGGGYGSSQALVFFSFIVPFLEDAIVKTLDETLQTCRVRRLKPEEPYIRETAMLLDGYLIDPIYRYMATIDQRIRGKGNPRSVGRRDVTDEIAEMVKFLDNCKDEMIQGIRAREGQRGDPEGQVSPAEIGRDAETTIAAIIISLFVACIFEVLVWLVPVTPFSWLKNHPNSYGLQPAIVFLVPCIFVGLLKRQYRKWCWGVGLVALLVLILSLLRGPPSGNVE